MIVVTGSSRTGTSMMMQTLINLGYPSVTPKFAPVHDNIIEYNRNGFYEIDLEDIKKLGEKDSTKAVKIFGNCLPYVDQAHVSKIIVMVRNREDASKSTVPLFDKLGYVGCVYKSYDANYKIIESYVKNKDTLFVRFETTIEYPEREVLKVVNFLEKEFTQSNINKAINNIKHYSHGDIFSER